MPSPDPPSPWRSVILWPALVAAAVFANTLWNGFVYDDPIILEWLESRSWDLEGFLLNTRGVTYAVHALDEALWGSNAAGFHLTNVLLHCATTALAAACALALGGSRRVALVTGLAFAVHPVHVEVVANVSNRKDMLATIFSLLGLMAWIRVDDRLRRIALTLACFGLGLYSKEVAAAGLFPMLLAYDLLLRPATQDAGQDSLGSRARRSLADLAPLLGAAVAAAFVFAGNLAAAFSAESIQKMSDGYYSTYGASLATSLGNLVDVFRLLLFPLELSIDYPIRPQESLFTPRALLGTALLVAWVALTLRVGRRSRLGAFALAWVPLSYLPCSNLVPLHHIHVAERYLYLPSFGLCLALGLGLDALLRARPARRPAALGAATLLLLAGAARSVLRNPDWRDIPALVAAAERDGIDTWRMHKTAGAWALQNGELEEAARRYARAAELRPGDPDLQFWKAVSASEVGDLETSIAAGRAAVALRPHNTKAHYNLGIALVQVGQLESATEHLMRAAELQPDYVPAHYNLGVALSLLGDSHGAYESFQRCAELQPENAEARFNLGTLQVERGEWEAALESLRAAVGFDPDNERFLEYLLSVSLRMDKPFAAIEAAEMLVLQQPERVDLLEQLGDLCARVGEHRKAVTAYRQAIGVEDDNVRLLQKIGHAAEALGKTDWATDAYERILALEPGNEAARAALESVRGQVGESPR